MGIEKFQDQIYAGVLGKIIGVYLGRPVEGWSYEKIQKEFGQIKYYIHEKVGVPLIVADDDISGTFGFFRALEDNGYDKHLPARAFGDTWLNYIIENRTILWWGGLGRSTEHTAYLNLKNGIDAPLSGAASTNGKTLSEQIGAQIFIDAFAMACPGDPDLAVDLVRKAASVSHDGIALQAACHLAALEAMAFEEKNLDKLLDQASKYVTHQLQREIIEDVRNICAKEKDWRMVREYLDPKYGYGVYPGCCHMVPNHAMVLASILLGGDDFQKSISIASSAAWDTDCNAGNVGAFNGIRLGIEGINAGADFRGPVADLMYVVTADGGSVVTDAVVESKKILKAAARFGGEKVRVPEEKYSFHCPGSVQGFAPCDFDHGCTCAVRVRNLNESTKENGLEIICDCVADGVTANVSTLTFIDFGKIAKNFSTTASPTLYSSQIVQTKAGIRDGGEVWMRPYILYYDINNDSQVIYGEPWKLQKTPKEYFFRIPDTKGMAIYKLGYQIFSEKHFQGSVALYSIHWDGAPTEFGQRGMLMNSIWNTNPLWMASFASSATHFAADFNRTYCVSHIEEDGLVTIGTKDWRDYTVESTLYFSLHMAGGMVIRSCGHRRYYGAELRNYKTVCLFVRKDKCKRVLKEIPFVYKEDVPYKMQLGAHGNKISLSINGKLLMEAEDFTYSCGQAGFTMSRGTMTCDSFLVSE